MKATFTLTDLPSGYLCDLDGMDASTAFGVLHKALISDKPGRAVIKMKIGNGDVRDACEFNALRKAPTSSWAFKIEPRKGYKLATFTVVA